MDEYDPDCPDCNGTAEKDSIKRLGLRNLKLMPDLHCPTCGSMIVQVEHDIPELGFYNVIDLWCPKENSPACPIEMAPPISK